MSGALEMPAESASVARNKRRARVWIDKRSALGRRVTQLTATFRARIGLDANPDPLLLAAIERVVDGEAAAAGAEKKPTVTVVEGVSAVYNDPATTQRLDGMAFELA